MTNEEAKEILKRVEIAKPIKFEDYADMREALDMAIKALEQIRWIPCSERLPEREGWYLTSLGDKTYGGVDVDMYCKGWVIYGTHVLAWMPLPQPYTESEEEG